MKVAIVGFGVVTFDSGKIFARSPIADYLNRWSEFADVTWFAQKGAREEHYGGLVSSNVTVRALERKQVANWKMLREYFAGGERRILLAAYPAFLLIAPCFYLPRWSCERIGIYIGNNFEAPSLESETRIEVAKRHVRAIVARQACRRADCVFARGITLTQRLRRLNPSTFETVPLTMSGMEDGEQDSPTSTDREAYFLYIGKLTPEKGVRELLEGYLGARCDRPNLPPLKIVGDGLLQDYVRSISKMHPSVEWLGYVDNPTALASIYRGASCLLIPTRASWEGVPRVIDEALAFGLSVWSSPLPTISGQFGSQIEYFESCPPTVSEISRVFCLPFSERRDGKSLPLSGGKGAASQHWSYLTAARHG